MELGLLAASLLDRSWDAMLDGARGHDIAVIEATAGGHVPKTHYDPSRLVQDADALAELRESLTNRGMRIGVIGCYGNALHPDAERAAAVHRDFEASCRLAAMLGVDRINQISGCPAGGPGDSTVNWIINSAFTEFREAYRWQWEERLIPYWKRAAAIARDHGLQICIEPHTGDAVYNPETFKRLRDAVGPTIALNLDPSHLWWQGIDPIEVIADLGETIGSCHVKDVSFDRSRVARTGVVSAADYGDWDGRTWRYRAVGYGHGPVFWGELVTALRRAGYERDLMIELEEPYMTADDALAKSVATMRAVLPSEGPPTSSWLDDYEMGADGRASVS